MRISRRVQPTQTRVSAGRYGGSRTRLRLGRPRERPCFAGASRWAVAHLPLGESLEQDRQTSANRLTSPSEPGRRKVAVAGSCSSGDSRSSWLREGRVIFDHRRDTGRSRGRPQRQLACFSAHAKSQRLFSEHDQARPHAGNVGRTDVSVAKWKKVKTSGKQLKHTRNNAL